jgi:hypothetical protein
MAGVNDLVFEERVKIMLGNIDLAVGTAIPGRGWWPASNGSTALFGLGFT